MNTLIMRIGVLVLRPRALCAAVTIVVGIMCVPATPALAGVQLGPEAFGMFSFEDLIENQDHSPTVQAGSHPYAMTTKIVFNHEVTKEEEECEAENPLTHALECDGEFEVDVRDYGDPKNLEANLPAGFVVNPDATPVKCTEAEFQSAGGCPNASAVGIIIAGVNYFGERLPAAVSNMVPPPGVPAELGFDIGRVGIVGHILGRVRTGGDYGLSGAVFDISQKVPVYGAKLTLWGDPSDQSHDAVRGECANSPEFFKNQEQEVLEHENKVKGHSERAFHISCPTDRVDKPFLTMPGSCTGNPLETTMSVESWQEPSNVIGPPAPHTEASTQAMTGCEKLDFSPSMNVKPAPEGVAADSPSGLSFDLKVPQEESQEGLAEADLRNAVVTLPAGMAVSPSAANGLGACPRLFGADKAKEEAEAKKEVVGIDLESKQPANCPDSSKVGEAEVTTPLLEHPLQGAVYLAQQNAFDSSLIGLYLVVEGSGAVVKLGGKVELGEPGSANGLQPGQIRTTFENNPQLPFNELKLKLFGGPNASLVTPSACGTFTTTSQLTPWSGNPPAEPSSAFTIGSGCTQGFSPAFTAGTANNQAGGFSPFSMTFSRQDGEQRFSGVRVMTPPGLLGVLKSVVQCPEPQAAKGECGPQSELGETTVAVGPGRDPYWVKGGKVYLTGPYGGAPFGLSIVVPTVAGPFTLTGNGGFGREIVRARVDVDSHTAQIVVTGDPLPTILQGIPLDVRTVNVTIDRPGFVFNPTNCSQLAVTGTLESTIGAKTGVSSPFEAANCANLPFKPSFKVSTPAKTSKAAGAGLTVKVGSTTGQANIAKVRVTLPKQLPARLTTLQKACTDTVFNANPALCPAASAVGTATAVSPLLAHPLTGPAYLVSHGGAAFPDLVFVLQGEGILLYLDGNTNIKKGITTSTFNSVPDAPISTFETVFPEGSHSVLATNLPAKAKGSMCSQKLTMPTTITGQNGAVMTQTTKISVTGCPKKPKPKKVSGKRKK